MLLWSEFNPTNNPLVEARLFPPQKVWTKHTFWEELESLKLWLKDNYEHNIKSVSFLLFKDHGFKQAPYQEIDEAAYLAANAKVKPLTNITTNSSEMLDMAECAGGACPIR